MKIIKIYYDKFADQLTFTRRKGLTRAITHVNVPDETKRDGDCIILPDPINACFKRRRMSATELYIRSVNGFGEGISLAGGELHGMHTFLMYGRHKAGICLHGEKFPCERCHDARKTDEKYGIVKTDAEFEERFIRKVQVPATA